MNLLKHTCAFASGVVLFSFGVAVKADVTITQQTSFDVALIKTHGSNVTAYSADKKRQDVETHCEGVMSIVCGNVQSGDIVRLDKGVTWQLEPKQKRYRESPFVTPEQLAAMREQMNARLEKMRSCPAAQSQQQQQDKSKCQMSPPKFDVKKTGERAMFLGHDSERTLGTITESCTNKDTGEVCDTVVAIDVWLTQDNLPGMTDRRNFDLAYAKKLGLDDPQGFFSGQMAQYFAAYQTQLSELSDKAKQFKGQPLKTSFRVLMGGPQCSSAKKDTQQAQGSDSSAPNPAADVANAGKAAAHFVGNLFKKKKQDDSADQPASAASPPPAAASAPAAADPFPQMTQLVSFTVETTDIKTDAVPASTFEVPADWTKEVPKQQKATKDDYSCPKTGS
jgi:hypothetical protein